MAVLKQYKVAGALPGSPEPNAVYYVKSGTSITLHITDSTGTPLALDTALLLQKANNLSDLLDTATARTNLGVEIGVNVQAYNAILENTTASFTTVDETKLNSLPNITVGTTAPGSPAVGDLWVDTN